MNDRVEAGKETGEFGLVGTTQLDVRRFDPEWVEPSSVARRANACHEVVPLGNQGLGKMTPEEPGAPGQ
jgi:hypothetical protein